MALDISDQWVSEGSNEPALGFDNHLQFDQAVMRVRGPDSEDMHGCSRIELFGSDEVRLARGAPLIPLSELLRLNCTRILPLVYRNLIPKDSKAAFPVDAKLTASGGLMLKIHPYQGTEEFEFSRKEYRTMLDGIDFWYECQAVGLSVDDLF